MKEKTVIFRDPNDRLVGIIIAVGSVILVCWWQMCGGFHHQRPDDHTTFEHLAGNRNPAYLIKAIHGAVASENELCSQMGVDTMKLGGNAIDAAISTTLCVGVVNMFSSGIGGGGFMTVRIPPKADGESSEVWTLDFRETAPALSNTTMYKDDPLAARWGGLSVGVPGELRGLQEAHRRWGSIPWKDLVRPSAKLAAGWRVQVELARRIQMFAPIMLKDPDLGSIFAPGGVLLKEGDMIYRANLSRTLSMIAEHGPDAFYRGFIADALVDKVRSAGGILSHEDLEKYQVLVTKALEGTYRNRKVYTTHAPGGGPMLLQMLNVLEHYEMEGITGLNIHRVVETMKFGFASRTRMCDPAYINDTQRLLKLSTKKYAAEIYANITDETTHPPEYYNPIFDVKPDHGTSHTSIVDRHGMAVAITSTVNNVFGSLVMDPVTGVLLNDEMDDFSTPGIPNSFGLWPSPYNYPEPGKRPVSSTTPTIIENSDGSFYAAMGGSGGTRIFTAVLQVLLNLEWGFDASAAVEFGRLHDQLYPTSVDADNIYPPVILDALRHRGHNVSVSDINRVAAVVQLVQQKDGIIYAASDSRKNGIAAGY